LNNNGIAEENEWEDISFNFYNAKNYTSVGVTSFPTYYQTSNMPVTPVALSPSRELSHHTMCFIQMELG
jgi:hypothetical protein